MKIHIHWGLGIGVVYGLFAIATTGFVMFAMTKPVELVSNDYYSRSLAYDQRLAAMHHARELGDALRVFHVGDDEALIVVLPREQASSASGTLTLYRPSKVAADHVVALAIDHAGLQHLSLRGLAAGHWVLKMDWEAQGIRYYREENVVVP
jgi:hypothetical protein